MKNISTIHLDHSTQYLVIDLSQQVRLSDYQLEILGHNPHPGIFPVEKRINDQIVKLYYKVEDKIPLTTCMKLRNLERDQLLTITENLTGILLDSNNYLLYPEGFLLDLEYIYINPQKMDVSLVYLPLKVLSDFPGKFKSLIKEILQQGQIYNNQRPDIEQILECLNAEPLNLLEFRMRCREVRYNLSGQIQDLKKYKLAVPNSQQMIRNISGSVLAGKQGRGDNRIRGIIIFSAIQVLYALTLFLATPLFHKLQDATPLYLVMGIILIFLNVVILRKLFSKKGLSHRES